MIFSTAGPDAKENINVTAEEQKMINRFARLNSKVEELQEKLNDIKHQTENLEEAENELLLNDDFGEDDELGDDESIGDMSKSGGNSEVSSNKGVKSSSNIQFVVGTSFMAVTKTEVKTLLEKRKEELKQLMKDYNEKLEPMKEEMNEIKSKLYAKFGNNINLDTDDS